MNNKGILCLFLVSVSTCIIKTAFAVQHEFKFASGSDIEVASFLESDLLQSSFSRSRIECYTQCALNENCLSLAYQTGICDLYSTYPPISTPIHGMHYVIFKNWCDISNGFIYIRHLNFCYKVIYTSMCCEEAVQTCLQLEATFIEINNQEKQIFVEEILDEMDIFSTFLEGYFINGAWSRFDGTPLLYTNWYTDDPENVQPDNTGNSGECLGMDVDYQYFWHDFDNTHQKGVICEQKEP